MDTRSDFEKLQACLSEIGIKFKLTDDSEESDIDESVDTVIVVDEGFGIEVLFLFTREGKFKEVAVF